MYVCTTCGCFWQHFLRKVYKNLRFLNLFYYIIFVFSAAQVNRHKLQAQITVFSYNNDAKVCVCVFKFIYIFKLQRCILVRNSGDEILIFF